MSTTSRLLRLLVLLRPLRLALRLLVQECETGRVLTIVHDDPDNLMALLGERVLVQLRYGKLTAASMADAGEKIVPKLLAQSGPIGALAVVNGDAGPPTHELRDRQRELIGGLLKRPNASMCTYMFGESTQAIAMRASGRVLLLGKGIHHAKDLTEAVTWLSGRLGDITALQLKDAVNELEKARKA